jgi:hypothetical protein
MSFIEFSRQCFILIIQLFVESTQELGYKLLVYISCCFAGRAYSVGNIPEELVKPVREQVFSSFR